MTGREFAMLAWLLVFAAPWLLVVFGGAWVGRRRGRSAVDLAGYRRRELERFPRSLP